jgi:hypothetical protein
MYCIIFSSFAKQPFPGSDEIMQDKHTHLRWCEQLIRKPVACSKSAIFLGIWGCVAVASFVCLPWPFTVCVLKDITDMALVVIGHEVFLWCVKLLTVMSVNITKLHGDISRMTVPRSAQSVILIIIDNILL